MVGNILRLMLGRGLSIIRWNNFPRVVDIKHMDNVGFTLHVALYLAYLEEYTYGKKVDKLYLIKKILFTSFADLLLSDINSGTKSYIKKLDTEIFQELYDKAFSHIYQFEGPEFLKKDMKETLESQDFLFEDTLFLAAKKYVGFVESTTNARVFPEMYEVPLADIQTSLSQLSKNLESVDFLLCDTHSQKFLAHIQRLSFAMRWNQYQRNTPISVMSHKVIVTYLTYIISVYSEPKNTPQKTLDMLMRAIYHDVPEVITGDIITPTKQAVPGFVELLEKVETSMVEDYLFSYVSNDYRKYIQKYMLKPFSGNTGKQVKYADHLSALFEAKLEDISGNKNFHEVSKSMMKHLSHIEHPGVVYILKDMVLYFSEVQEDILQ